MAHEGKLTRSISNAQETSVQMTSFHLPSSRSALESIYPTPIPVLPFPSSVSCELDPLMQNAASTPVLQHVKLRSGKWVAEEEEYADLLIQLFLEGKLPDCGKGCTLRSFLSKKLHCAPMRISKKFAGRGIGKMVYAGTHPESVGDPDRDKLLERAEKAQDRFQKALLPAVQKQYSYRDTDVMHQLFHTTGSKQPPSSVLSLDKPCPVYPRIVTTLQSGCSRTACDVAIADSTCYSFNSLPPAPSKSDRSKPVNGSSKSSLCAESYIGDAVESAEAACQHDAYRIFRSSSREHSPKTAFFTTRRSEPGA